MFYIYYFYNTYIVIKFKKMIVLLFVPHVCKPNNWIIFQQQLEMDKVCES